MCCEKASAMSSNPSENPTDSEPNQGHGDEQGDQQRSTNTIAPARKKKYLTKRAVRIWNLVIQSALLLVGVGYCWFSWRQLKALGVQLTLQSAALYQATAAQTASEANNHLDQRAWVALTNVEGIPAVGQIFTVTVTVKNTGKTFAKNFRMPVVIEKLPKDKKPDFGWADLEADKRSGSVSLLPPNAEYGTNTEVDITATGKPPADVTQAQIDEIKSGEYSIFIYGKLHYTDIFNCEHWTTFCSEILPTMKYRICTEHNDADNNNCQ